MSRSTIRLVLCLIAAGLALPGVAAALPPLPAGWPASLQLGVADGPGGAPQLRATGFGFRYQYLGGGVNTGNSWGTWLPAGTFVTEYIQESVTHGIVPVFSYYMLVHSAPGNGQPERTGVYTNLQTTATMEALYDDLALFFQRAGAFPGHPLVLHVEPDFWGYMQLRATGDAAASVPARVAATGRPELAGLPDTVAGVAQAIVRLRNAYAPNVLLAYHLSVWGTGVDIDDTDPPGAEVDGLAARAGAFFNSLGPAFDIVFAEFSDRDAGYNQYHLGDGGRSWWDAADFARMARFLAGFVGVTQKRVVMWQIPLGNTKMRAMNNTWGHYQDNIVEWFLADPTRAHFTPYVQAGVVAFLFGRALDGTTCACDAAGDGVTDPAPINGNTRVSLSADDDGGFFRHKAAAYYAAGALPVDTGGPAPPPPPPVPASWTTTATASRASVRPGARVEIQATIRSTAAAAARVDIVIRDPSGQRVARRVFDDQTFAASESRTYRIRWRPPATAAVGTYTVKLRLLNSSGGSVFYRKARAAQFVVVN